MGMSDNSIHTVHSIQEVHRMITESRLGAELWKQFLIAALIIAIIEMLVARERTHSPSMEATSTRMKESL
jgi:ferric iron reductase protein FhuF